MRSKINYGEFLIQKELSQQVYLYLKSFSFLSEAIFKSLTKCNWKIIKIQTFSEILLFTVGSHSQGKE